MCKEQALLVSMAPTTPATRTLSLTLPFTAHTALDDGMREDGGTVSYGVSHH